jgi:hypothetical protein
MNYASKKSVDYDCEELCNIAENLIIHCPYNSALSLVKDSMQAIIYRVCVCYTTQHRSRHFLLVYFYNQIDPVDHGVAVLELSYGESHYFYFRPFTL